MKRTTLLLLITVCSLLFVQAQEGKYISVGKDKTAPPTAPPDTLVGESAGKVVRLSTKPVSYLEVDWVKPVTTTVTVSTPTFDLEIKIFTSEPIRPEQVKVLVNGKPAGSKADEVSLIGMKNEFTFRGKIPLAVGANKVEVEVVQGNQFKKSQPITITRSGAAVAATAKPEVFLYWISPNPVDLEGRPVVVKTPEMGINLNLVCDKPVALSQVSLLVNDQPRPLSARAALRGTAPRFSVSEVLALPPSTAVYKVALRATVDGREYRSEPLLVNFSPFKPNLHLLSIGVQSNLQFAAKDARDVAQVFGSQGGVTGNRLFGGVQVESLTGKDATAYNISRQVEKLHTRFQTGNIDSSDVVMLFISTHGFIADNGEFRLQGDDFDPAARRTTSVSYPGDILDVLDRIPCKKIVLIDACHSGGIDGSKASPAAVNVEIEKLNKVKKGLTTIVSSQGFEQSYEDVSWQNGAFTRALLDGLAYGRADADRNKIVTVQELYSYLSREVPGMVRRVKNQSQTPQLINNELGNVAIYVIE
jgi:hypothetical protein